MRRLIVHATIPFLCGLVFAQTEAARQESQTKTQTETRKKHETTSGASGTSDLRQGQPSVARTQRYRGTLVDANCIGGSSSARGISSTTHETSSTTSADRSATTPKPDEQTTSSSSTRGGRSRADRSSTSDQSTATSSSSEHRGMSGSSDQAQRCPVTSSTNSFALVLSDGRVARFDEIGNMRASDMLKNNKKWSEKVSNNKHITAKVDGTLEGDKLTVVTID